LAIVITERATGNNVIEFMAAKIIGSIQRISEESKLTSCNINAAVEAGAPIIARLADRNEVFERHGFEAAPFVRANDPVVRSPKRFERTPSGLAFSRG
jgi:hypothetical protein